jgi:hypothetical protein
MGLFDKIFGKTAPKESTEKVAPPAATVKKARAPRTKKPTATPTKTAKDIANENNEPYINILSVEIDPTNIGNGAFELDWNDKFVANLVRAGYKGKTDQQIVDQWFQDVCRNVVLETYEQDQADPEQRIASSRKKLDGGRTEFS